MGKLVKFPVPNIQVEGLSPLPDHCSGIIHIFDDVPGTCRCGEEKWTVDGLLDPPEAIGLHEAS